MKKIRKFRIALRKREVISNLKLAAGIKEITPQLEELIVTETARSASFVSPESIFETYQLPVLETELGLQFEAKLSLVAATIIVVTVGEKIDAEIRKFEEKGEHIASQVLNAIGLEGCNAGMNFILKIVKEEANREDCELLPVEKINSPELRAKITATITASKINVFIDAQNNLRPQYTSMGIIKWKPRKKK